VNNPVTITLPREHAEMIFDYLYELATHGAVDVFEDEQETLLSIVYGMDEIVYPKTEDA